MRVYPSQLPSAVMACGNCAAMQKWLHCNTARSRTISLPTAQKAPSQRCSLGYSAMLSRAQQHNYPNCLTWLQNSALTMLQKLISGRSILCFGNKIVVGSSPPQKKARNGFGPLWWPLGVGFDPVSSAGRVWCLQWSQELDWPSLVPPRADYQL